MKLVIAILALAAAAQGARLHRRTGEMPLVHPRPMRMSNATAQQSFAVTYSPKYGSPKCPCVGIDNLEGTTEMEAYRTITYPADVGAHCNAWEQESHPACKGDRPPKWCQASWCFVDPCNCKSVVPPKRSAYLRSGEIAGRPVHYSYATCGSRDLWSTRSANRSRAAQSRKRTETDDIAALCAKRVDERRWGKPECRCVGIDGQKGVTQKYHDGKNCSYPADAGARCRAWDADNHPECRGDRAPAWCHEAWCYVDPCSCDLGEPSKPPELLPDAKYQGRPVHLSYATCGATDSWSSSEAKAQTEENKHICDERPRPAARMPTPFYFLAYDDSDGI